MEETDHHLDEFLAPLHGSGAVVGGKELATAIDMLSPAVRRFGVDGRHIPALVRVATSSRDSRIGVRVVRELLIPRTATVPVPAVLKAVLSSLATSQALTDTHVVLFSWLATIITNDDTQSHYPDLCKYYPMLFHNLQYTRLRPSIARILAIITTSPSHVKAFRVRKLLEFYADAGTRDERGIIIALLVVYEAYAPGIVDALPVSDVEMKSGSVWRKVGMGRDWMDTLIKVQQRYSEHMHGNEQRGYVAGDAQDAVTGSKRRRVSVDMAQLAPTLRHLPISSSSHVNSVYLDRVATIQEFADGVDSIVLPAQIAAVLGRSLQRKNDARAERYLAYMILYSPDATVRLRFGHWISSALDELAHRIGERTTHAADTAAFEALLVRLVHFTDMVHLLPPTVDHFLANFLQTWDGEVARRAILRLVAQIPPQDFAVLYERFMQPLIRRFETRDARFTVDVLRCLQVWLRTWTRVEWSTMPQSVDYRQTVAQFVEVFNHVASLAVELYGENILVQDAVLSFYETAALLWTKYGVPVVVFPPATVVYCMLAATNAMVMSRMCGVLIKLKSQFEYNTALANGHDIPVSLRLPWEPLHDRGVVNIYNGFILDVCNAFWRNRALSVVASTSQASSLASTQGAESVFGLPRTVAESVERQVAQRGYSSASILSLTQSVALGPFARRYLRDLEGMADTLGSRHTEPISSRSIDLITLINNDATLTFGEFRIGLLEYLRERGMMGLYDMLYGSMVSLAKARQEREARMAV